MSDTGLKPHQTPAAEVAEIAAGAWRLVIPAGRAGQYRLAQLDDYRSLSRQAFPWQPPLRLTLEARASADNLPGTWGFGLWNDPFGNGLAYGGTRLLPALPKAAWFFFASEQNYLSFRNDQPAHGALAGVFRSPSLPVWPFLPLAPLAVLLAVRPLARIGRRMAAGIVREHAAALGLDVTRWHNYAIDWRSDGVIFSVDGQVVDESPVSPTGPLGLVVWIDNQYAAWRPDGRLGYGTLAGPEAWIEVRGLAVT
jgi:hypothetical protein